MRAKEAQDDALLARLLELETLASDLAAATSLDSVQKEPGRQRGVRLAASVIAEPAPL